MKDPLIMVITAAFGLLCNIAMAKVLHTSPTGDDSHNNNLFHQCSHDHGHGGHSHAGHSHGDHHHHDNAENKKKSKVVLAADKASGISIPEVYG